MKPSGSYVDPDDIRVHFSRAMSDMYRAEVPLYGALLALVAQVNRDVAGSRRRKPGL